MASSEARTTALLFSLSALVFLLLARAVLLQPQQRHRRGALADLLLAALHRFLDGRSVLDLATRTNMVLLCHAILFLILRDAGILGSPSTARRRAASQGVVAATADAEGACCSTPTRTHEAVRRVVVWRPRPRNITENDARVDESGRRLLKRRQPRRSPQPQPATAAATPRAAPAPAEPEQQPLVSKEIVLVEKAPRNYVLDDHDRAAAGVVETDRHAAASAMDGKSDFDRRVAVVTDHERNANTAAEEAAEMELADDWRIEEFIANQWRMMRQESLRLVMSGSQRAIATC